METEFVLPEKEFLIKKERNLKIFKSIFDKDVIIKLGKKEKEIEELLKKNPQKIILSEKEIEDALNELKNRIDVLIISMIKDLRMEKQLTTEKIIRRRKELSFLLLDILKKKGSSGRSVYSDLFNLLDLFNSENEKTIARLFKNYIEEIFNQEFNELVGFGKKVNAKEDKIEK